MQVEIDRYAKKIDQFLYEINQIVLDKPEQTKLALTCLLANGHVLFEDLPGLGKTTLASALARLAGLDFSRIQFTNDMLASDVIGVNLFNQQKHQFEFKQGPIFTEILLADEINRSSPKTQSALLEAMEEGTVTVDQTQYALPVPFWVIATQNSVDQSGTYPLPESQLDRFLMRLSLGYPSRQAEKILLQQPKRPYLLSLIQPVFTKQDIAALQHVITTVHLSDAILDYILNLVAQTRKQHVGLSTRATLALKVAAQAYAFIDKRSYVLPDDVQAVFVAIAAHRMNVKNADALQYLTAVDVLSL